MVLLYNQKRGVSPRTLLTTHTGTKINATTPRKKKKTHLQKPTQLQARLKPCSIGFSRQNPMQHKLRRKPDNFDVFCLSILDSRIAPHLSRRPAETWAAARTPAHEPQKLPCRKRQPSPSASAAAAGPWGPVLTKHSRPLQARKGGTRAASSGPM